ncbi:MAG: hypothetical protein OXI16_00045 [Chloroflexota bacterium]|nr:hypothetical protein [Chloroflexota bacterium]
MDIIRRIVGIFLLIVAVAVAVHTIVEPLYFDSRLSESGYNESIWAILNPLMALAVILGAIFAYFRKRDVGGAGDDTVTREFLTANVLFYGLLFIGILFFWNWFNLLSAAYNAIGPDAISLTWIVIDAALPLLTGALGIHLLLDGADG